jgi:hypothetical protein
MTLKGNNTTKRAGMSESEQQILHLRGRSMGRSSSSNPGVSRDLDVLTASRPAAGPAKFSLKGKWGEGKLAEA